MICKHAKRCCELNDESAEPLTALDLDDESIFSMTSHEIGRLGERLAATYLAERGYEIVESNYRCDEGEADIVVFDEEADEVVLVEVKTRRRRSHDGDAYPEEAVDERKRCRYRRIASCYVMGHYPVSSIRFDVIGITLYPDCMAELQHLYNAYEWEAQ